MNGPYQILETKKLQFGYKKHALTAPVQLQLYAGELVCLIGPNGCGKSTLIRTLSGLQRPVGGSILVKGKNIHSLSNTQRAQLISVVLTDAPAIKEFSVQQLVRLGRHPHTNWLHHLHSNDQEIVAQAISQVHLNKKIDKRLSELSDGEQQRACIARALAQDTPILFLDEPTSFLDLPNRISILLLLKELAHATNKAILLSIHDLDLALQIADRLWLLNQDGLFRGIPEDLVLEGKIESTFVHPSWHLNTEQGGFTIQQVPGNKSVCLEGEPCPAYYWTLKALMRKGYAVTPSANLTIRMSTQPTWTLKIQRQEHTFYHLENLLFALENQDLL